MDKTSSGFAPRAAVITIAGVISFAAAGAHAVDYTWTPAELGTDEGKRWNNQLNWSPVGLPGGSDRVLVNSVFGPLLNVNAAIQHLTLDDGYIDTVGVGGHALNVTGTTTLSGDNPQLYTDSGDRVSLGTLTNYSNGVLSGVDDDYYLFDETNTGSIMEFRGADIRDLHANVYLIGPNVRFIDQNTGLSALRNWETNRGFFAMGEGADLATSASLTNHNYLAIGERYDTRGFATNLEIGGSLTNTEAGGIDVIADTLLRVGGDLTNDGGIRVGDSSGQTTGSSRLVVVGDLVSRGRLRLYHGGSLNVGGTVYIENGSQLEVDGNSGFETFKMTAERIDIAVGSLFGARGTLFCDLVDRGVLSPGSSPGRLTVNGSIELTASARTEIELAGIVADAQYDQVVQVAATAGDATKLGGTLSLTLLAGYVPGYGVGHRIFSVASRTGTFGNVTGHQVSADRWLAVTYDTTGVVVTGAIPGDANLNMIVGFDDLLSLAQHYGQASGGTWSAGDFDGNGGIDFDDLLTLAQHYGTSGLTAGEVAMLGGDFAADFALAQSLVPEPTALLSGSVALVALARRRRTESGRLTHPSGTRIP